MYNLIMPTPEDIKSVLGNNESASPEKQEQDSDIIEVDKKNKHELAAVPIFRANDLYSSLFPEVKPVFERGEEPTAKKIFDAILEHKNQEVILDQTCLATIMGRREGSKLTPEDFPPELGLQEVPLGKDGSVDFGVIRSLLKEKFHIIFPSIEKPFPLKGRPQTIDRKIENKMQTGFSPETVKWFLELSKKENQNIERVYINTDFLTDHVGTFPKEKVLDTLKAGVQEIFGIEPTIITDGHSGELGDRDLVIADRHSNLARSLKEKKQLAVLPISDQMIRNEKIKDTPFEASLAKNIREDFEKKENNN